MLAIKIVAGIFAPGYELKLHPVVTSSLMSRINEGTLSQLPPGHPWARCSTCKPPSARVTCLKRLVLNLLGIKG